MVRLAAMQRVREWRKARLSRQINKLTRRIRLLTEAIDGTDYDFWPEHYNDLQHDRQAVALRRSRLTAKLLNLEAQEV